MLKEHGQLPGESHDNWEKESIERKNRDIELIITCYKNLNMMGNTDPIFFKHGYLVLRHFTDWPINQKDIQQINSGALTDDLPKMGVEKHLWEKEMFMFLREVLIRPSGIVLFCDFINGLNPPKSFNSLFNHGLHVASMDQFNEYKLKTKKLHYYETR